jgi:hypothetical protein
MWQMTRITLPLSRPREGMILDTISLTRWSLWYRDPPVLKIVPTLWNIDRVIRDHLDESESSYPILRRAISSAGDAAELDDTDK